MKIPLLIAAACLVTVAGVGMYVTDFAVYLGNDPNTCNNCHVMDAAYEGWFHAPHSKWAACNDCHTPHDFVRKYLVKAENGFRHVSVFTLGHIPDAIRARPASQQVVQANCLRCHQQTVENVADGVMDSGRYCWECHRDIAHGERGISILPYQEGAK